MINRLIIRTRILQLAYAYQHRDQISLIEAEKEFDLCLRRTYDLYLYLFRLIPSLTDFYCDLVETRKQKHIPTDKDRNPNTRLIHNRLASAIETDERISLWYTNFDLNWQEEQTLLRRLINTIEQSDIFQAYRNAPNTFEADRDFWVQIFQNILFGSQELAEYLDKASPYWDNALQTCERIECEEQPALDKIEEEIELAQVEQRYRAIRFENAPTEIIKEFFLKTLRRATENESGGLGEALLPQFRSDEDEAFAHHLFRQLFLKREEREQLISESISADWERERLADIDHLLIEMGIVEFLHFPGIPTWVSINEYVELSKHYSTNKSSAFINGVLDTIAKKLKEEQRILKN